MEGNILTLLTVTHTHQLQSHLIMSQMEVTAVHSAAFASPDYLA